MTLHRRQMFPAATLVLCGLVSLAPIATCSAAEIDQGKQYCIARGGVNGDNSYVGSCNYSDYQQCLEAAVGVRGNCVSNIDYHGDTTPAAPPRRSRRAR